MQSFDDSSITLYGGNGYDNLNGGKSNDYLYGENDDDRILGYEGNDTLDGGSGNDYLEGSAGNDTYIFDIGYGTDTINDNQGNNVIALGKELSQKNISIDRIYGNDLVLMFEGTNDRIIIQGYFTSEDNRKFEILLVDGTRFDISELKKETEEVPEEEVEPLYTPEEVYEDLPEEVDDKLAE